MCFAALTFGLTPSMGNAAPMDITVSIENLAPFRSTSITPLWVGFHDGTFDTYSDGQSASVELERLAEDGNTAPLSASFIASGKGTVDGALSGPLGHNGRTSQSFSLEPSSPQSRFFSYAAMIVPSNDAFIANGDPTSIAIFDANGQFLPQSFFIVGSQIFDAGTEVNDEIPMNTALLGQTVPNTGTAEAGSVHVHPGFNPKGSGGILDVTDFTYADFLAAGYPVAHITIVPEPSVIALSGLGCFLLLVKRFRST